MTAGPENLEEAIEAARNIAASVLASDAVAVDREARWPERGIRALQEAGLAHPHQVARPALGQRRHRRLQRRQHRLRPLPHRQAADGISSGVRTRDFANFG